VHFVNCKSVTRRSFSSTLVQPLLHFFLLFHRQNAGREFLMQVSCPSPSQSHSTFVFIGRVTSLASPETQLTPSSSTSSLTAPPSPSTPPLATSSRPSTPMSAQAQPQSPQSSVTATAYLTPTRAGTPLASQTLAPASPSTPRQGSFSVLPASAAPITPEIAAAVAAEAVQVTESDPENCDRIFFPSSSFPASNQVHARPPNSGCYKKGFHPRLSLPQPSHARGSSWT